MKVYVEERALSAESNSKTLSGSLASPDERKIRRHYSYVARNLFPVFVIRQVIVDHQQINLLLGNSLQRPDGR